MAFSQVCPNLRFEGPSYGFACFWPSTGPEIKTNLWKNTCSTKILAPALRNRFTSFSIGLSSNMMTRISDVLPHSWSLKLRKAISQTTSESKCPNWFWQAPQSWKTRISIVLSSKILVRQNIVLSTDSGLAFRGPEVISKSIGAWVLEVDFQEDFEEVARKS